MATNLWSMPSRIGLQAKRAYLKYRFGLSIREILDTPPIPARTSGILVVSMVGRSQLLMYIAAVKSFLAQLGDGQPLVVSDGTLDAAHRLLLQKHLPGIEIVDCDAIAYSGLPRGGTWERLMLIAQRVVDKYLIQLDSDTLTLGPLPEVHQQVDKNLPFILGGEATARILPLSQTPYNPHWHVIRKLEASFRDHPDREILRYARGCSAFSGFPRGAPVDRIIAQFAAWQEKAIGKRASEWGTEQVASNYVLANLDGALLLPYERYFNHIGLPVGPDAQFVHFIGTHRFDHDRYRTRAREVIRRLQPA